MKFFSKKGHKNHFQKGIVTVMLMALLSFQIPHAFAENDPYSVPENWPSDWIVPFADEQEVTPPAPVVPQYQVRSSRRVTATAYSSDVHQTDAQPFRPAMAMDFRDVVAEHGAVNCIAHNDLRLGTQVRFPELFGETVYTVCDRMNARYTGNARVDFYFYVIGEDGRIDSIDSLNAARANARAFGLRRSQLMEVVVPIQV